MIIQTFNARKILNSRKEPTIAVQIKTKEGTFESSAPEGASKGENEVLPFSKKGIEVSIQFANALGQRLIREQTSFNKFQDLEKIESMFHEVDKSKRLELTGGNTLFAIESVLLKTIAASYKKEVWQFLYDEDNAQNKGALILTKAPQTPKIPTYKNIVFPRPLGNCIGGGKHTQELEKPDFQEFLILPDAKSKRIVDTHYISLQAYNEIKNALKKQDKLFYGKITDEHAFISSFDNEKIIKLMQEIQSKIKTRFNETLELGLDIAASSFFDTKKKLYNYTRLNGKPGTLKIDEQIDYIFELCKKYNLAYVEDPLDENNFSGFSKLLKKIKKAGLKTLIVGDDLICTNSDRLKKAIKSKSINAAIIKPNQTGSLLKTKRVVDLAKKNNIVPVISHRSGETPDNILAELALGWQIPIIKISVVGPDAFKTNDLIRIERKLG